MVNRDSPTGRVSETAGSPCGEPPLNFMEVSPFAQDIISGEEGGWKGTLIRSESGSTIDINFQMFFERPNCVSY